MVRPRESQAALADSRKLELLVGRILLWGGLLSMLVVLTGFALNLWKGSPQGNEAIVRDITGHALQGETPHVFVSGAQIIRGLRASPMDPLAIITLGLVVLLATPVASVMLAVPAFAAIRDYCYLVICLIILGILAAGFFIGAG
jgi:uncharacterized membrane protein